MKFRHLNFRTPSRDGLLSSGDQPRLKVWHITLMGMESAYTVGPYNNASMWTLDSKLPQQKISSMVMYGLYSHFCSHSLGQKLSKK